MPTPVSSARTSLAGDASAALDAAVAAARRRSHPQTTSLHLLSTLLSSPSLLRDAVARSHSSYYSPRLQSKALDLCFSVSLDRLPSASASASATDPPVSNSLMAAIKRSQAHQRRNPDLFHLYRHHQQHQQHQFQQSSSFSGVKVELQQLLVAILDDPVVSRVFAEAGFRSCDIKLSILRPPPPPILPRPIFLCNFESDPISDGGEENCRRIGEVLAQRPCRNPVLVGVGAAEAAREYCGNLQLGMRIVSIEREVSELASDASGVVLSSIGMRLVEAMRAGEEEGGVVVSVGDLKGLVVEGDGGGGNAGRFLVSELTRVLEVRRGRLWVLGWSGTYEIYMKFLSRYPMVDKDWDLQLLPITFVKPVNNGLIGRPNSLMKSFVPLGGFFPASYVSKTPLTKLYHSAVCCQHCSEKYEQEVATLLKECSTSVKDLIQENMPAPLWEANMLGMNDGLDSIKARDDKSGLSVKIRELQKKWNDNCQHIHGENYQVLSDIGSTPCRLDERASYKISNNQNVDQNQSVYGNAVPSPVSLQKSTKDSQSISFPSVFQLKDKDLISKLQVRMSKSEQFQEKHFKPSQDAQSELSTQHGHASPSSVTSVSTELVLAIRHDPSCKEQKLAVSCKHVERLDDLSGCFPMEKIDEFSPNVTEFPGKSFPCSTYSGSHLKDKYPACQTLSDSKVTGCSASTYDPHFLSSSMCNALDPDNYKALYASLVEKVGRQEEAMRAISEAIVCCRTGHESHYVASLRGDIWLRFLGSDRAAKRRTAVALAELIFGSRNNLICIDLGCQNGSRHQNTLFHPQETSEFYIRLRGKTIVDHIAEEVGKNPSSVVFLDNINKADWLVQNSLTKAMKTGKISNSSGREFSINNAIFLISAQTIHDKDLSPVKECIGFTEERILETQGWQMKMLIESNSEPADTSKNVNMSIASRYEPKKRSLPSFSVFVSKRKLYLSDEYTDHHGRSLKKSNTFLDLNHLPVEQAVIFDADCSSSDENGSDNSLSWLDGFLHSTSGTVKFEPFDFNGLADHILEDISRSFHSVVGCECMLEIDVKVMEHILAAIWLSDSRRQFDNWLENVLARSLIELKGRYSLSSPTILKLVACEDAHMDSAAGILLPSRIIVD